MILASFVARRPYFVVGCSGSLALFLVTAYVIAREYAWHEEHIHPRWKSSTAHPRSLSPDHEQPARKMCAKDYFSDVLLIISFGVAAEYEVIPLFELLYAGGFPNRLYCGPAPLPNETLTPYVVVDTKRGAFQYECLISVLQRGTQRYRGYLFAAEEILINYQQLIGLKLDTIWIDGGITAGPAVYTQIPDDWEWWASPWGMRAVEKVFETFVEISYSTNRKSKLSDGDWNPDWDVEQALNSWLWNGRGEYIAYYADRTVAYLPHTYASAFTEIGKRFRSSGVRHAIAFPTILNMLGQKESFVDLSQASLNGKGSNILSSRSSLVNATEHYHFLYVKGGRKQRHDVLGDLKIKEIAMGRFLRKGRCP